MKAKKSYGQHFLKETTIARRIADSLIHTDLYDEVLEIGPGKGMLTQFLLDRPYTLKAVEADKDMIAYLNHQHPQLSENLIQEDVLKLDLTAHFDQQFAVIGNFPYNISSQILFKIIDNKTQIPEMVGMFQKEVARRVASPPGSKEYGVISVLIQAWYEVEYLFGVAPGSFDPPPKVQSAVIRLVRRENQELGCKPSLFRSVVKTTFGQRRKMLRKTLRSFTKHPRLQEDPFFQRRPETLGVQDFVDITKWLEDTHSSDKNQSS